jgi:hypothetical protein
MQKKMIFCAKIIKLLIINYLNFKKSNIFTKM